MRSSELITTMSPENVEGAAIIRCIGAAVIGLRWLVIRCRWVILLIVSQHSNRPKRDLAMWRRVLSVREEGVGK